MVATFVVHKRTGMCDQDRVIHSCRLTGNHGKTEIKKTTNHTVVREGMLDREYLWLRPTTKLDSPNKIRQQIDDLRQAFPHSADICITYETVWS